MSIGWTKSDSRPSAIATGAGVGIVFCVLPLLLVFILDLTTVYRDFRRAMYNITGNEKYRPKEKTKKPKSGKTEYPKESISAMQDAVTLQDGVRADDPGEGTSGLQDAIIMPPGDRIRCKINKSDRVNQRNKLIARRKLGIYAGPSGVAVGETI